MPNSEFNCIPNSCARVVYQKYEPPRVRYRYQGEEWKEVYANNYEFEQRDEAQCPGVIYAFRFTFTAVSGSYERGSNGGVLGTYQRTKSIAGTLSEIEYIYWGRSRREFYRDEDDNLIVEDTGERYLSGARIHYKTWDGVETSIFQSFVLGSETGAQEGSVSYTVDMPFENREDDCESCTFRVFKDGVPILEREESECPEVELIEECQLSEEHEEIRVRKIPFFQRVDVLNHGIAGYYDSWLQGEVVTLQYEIPPNCLNIYTNFLTSPAAYGAPDNNVQLFLYEGQICSAEGCPPPEFEVICDCDCQSCPDDTCAVPCGDHVCCYNVDGVSVETIPLEDYCEL